MASLRIKMMSDQLCASQQCHKMDWNVDWSTKNFFLELFMWSLLAGGPHFLLEDRGPLRSYNLPTANHNNDNGECS